MKLSLKQQWLGYFPPRLCLVSSPNSKWHYSTFSWGLFSQISLVTTLCFTDSMTETVQRKTPVRLLLCFRHWCCGTLAGRCGVLDSQIVGHWHACVWCFGQPNCDTLTCSCVVFWTAKLWHTDMLVCSVLDNQIVIHEHAGVHVVFWTAKLCSVLDSQIV